MSIYVDEVGCTNCGKKFRVKVGREDCPNCEKEGTLFWLNEPVEVVGEPGEIEDEQ